MTEPNTLPPLFYHPELEESDQHVVIVGQEAAHISRSRRLGEGDSVHLTDGNGVLVRCRMVSLQPRPLVLQLAIEQREVVSRPTVEMVLAAALVKGERQSVMLDMATQLGMSRFIPLRCERSVVRFQPGMVVRWQRIIRSSCKQCRQCYFPILDEEKDITPVVEAKASTTLMWVGDHNGMSISQIDPGIMKPVENIILLVGPEGGFSDIELEILAQHGASRVALGKQILRTETAAVSLLAAVNHFLR